MKLFKLPNAPDETLLVFDINYKYYSIHKYYSDGSFFIWHSGIHEYGAKQIT